MKLSLFSARRTHKPANKASGGVVGPATDALAGSPARTWKPWNRLVNELHEHLNNPGLQLRLHHHPLSRPRQFRSLSSKNLQPLSRKSINLCSIRQIDIWILSLAHTPSDNIALCLNVSGFPPLVIMIHIRKPSCQVDLALRVVRQTRRFYSPCSARLFSTKSSSYVGTPTSKRVIVSGIQPTGVPHVCHLVYRRSNNLAW